jgi:hypothetical protein
MLLCFQFIIQLVQFEYSIPCVCTVILEMVHLFTYDSTTMQR